MSSRVLGRRSASSVSLESVSAGGIGGGVLCLHSSSFFFVRLPLPVPSELFAVWTLGAVPWAAGGAALLVALALTPAVGQWARRMGWVDQPSEARWRDRSVALLGGVALACGVAVGLLVSGAIGAYAWPVWVGAGLVFAVGLADDVWSLRPEAKLVAQVAAAALLLYAGHAFWRGGPLWASVPLTFFWVIGITNAVNLIDGIDGLAGSIAAVAGVVLALLSGLLGQPGLAAVAAAVAGASLGFLVYNAKPARIFMGDCGSLLLGYLLAVIALGVQGAGGPVVGTLVPVVVLAVPIFDTTFVTVTRILRGQSVAEGGNDHTHHRLVRLGLSETGAVLALSGISGLFGLAALLLLQTTAQLFLALVLLGVVACVGVGLYLAGGPEAQRPEAAPPDAATGEKDAPVRSGERGVTEQVGAVMRAVAGGPGWKSVVGVAADLLVVVAAFVVAGHLRFGGRPPAPQMTLIGTALPAVAAAKVLMFYVFGLYHGVWRHAGTPEVVRVLKASAAASVVSGVGLAVTFGLGRVSVALLVVDWLIATAAVGGLRFGFRALRQYFAAQRDEGRRVLLYGSTSQGLLALRHLRRSEDLAVVGFLDDDPDRHGLRTQGLEVMGGPADLDDLASVHSIDELVVPRRAASPEQRHQLAARCRRLGLVCRQFSAALHPINGEAPGDGGPSASAPAGDGAQASSQPAAS